MDKSAAGAEGTARVVDAALEGARSMGPAAVERIRSAYPFKRKVAAGRPGMTPEILRLADALFEAVCGKTPLERAEDRLVASAALLYFIHPADAVPDAATRGLVDDARIIRHVAQHLGLDRKAPALGGAFASILAKARAPAPSAPVEEAPAAAPTPPDPAAIEALAENFCTPEGRAWFLDEVGRSRRFLEDPDPVVRRFEASLTSVSAEERHAAAADLRRLARFDFRHLDRLKRRWAAITDGLVRALDREGLRRLREEFCEADPSVETSGPPPTAERARALLSSDPIGAAAIFGRLRDAGGAAEAVRRVLASYRPVVRLAEEADDLLVAADLAGAADLRAAVERAALEVVLGRVAAERAVGPEATLPDGSPALSAEEALLTAAGGGPRRTVEAAKVERDPVTGARLGGRGVSLDKAATDLDRMREARAGLRPRVRRTAAAALQVRGYLEAAGLLWAEAIAEEEGRRRLRAARDVAVAAGRDDLYETYEKAIAFLSGPPGVSTPEG